MRMWMVDPKIMCRKHLLGEHVELHMFIGSMRSGSKILGYIKKNLLEPRSLTNRHIELAQEMKNRGYKHLSELDLFDDNLISDSCRDEDEYYHKIDREKSLQDLLNRCPECKSRYNQKF